MAASKVVAAVASGSVAVVQEASPAELSNRELVSRLGDLDRVVPSTHVFFGTGLSSTTPSSSSPAVRFFPFDDSLPINGLLTSRADGVSSIDDPIMIILLAIGVVDKAAFASREPSTARRFMGDETASILFSSSSMSREEGICLNKQNQSAAR